MNASMHLKFTIAICAVLLLARAGPAQAQNLLNNPGFEQNPILWTPRGPELLTRTNTAHTGSAAILVSQRSADWQGISQSLLGKVRPGVNYFCSAWARVNSTNPQPLTLSIELQSEDGPHSFPVAERAGAGAFWYYLSGTFTLSVTGALQKAVLCLSGPASGVDFLADDLVVIPSSGLRALPGGAWFGGIMSYPTFPNEPIFARVTGRDYDIAGTENALKFQDIHPGVTTYSFTAADTIVNAAMTNGQNARGHTLVWHSAIPGWVTGGGYTPTQLQSILFSHIDTVVGRYKDKLFCWDVVNEAFEQDGTMRNAFWYNQPGFGYAGQGTKYLEEVFKRARSADADAELFYNDWGTETINPKSSAVYAMAQDFKNRGVPLDGIGFQMHVPLGEPNISSWRSNLQRFNDLGMKLHITEMDVRIPVDTNGVASTANLDAQADVYFNVIGTALAFPNLKVVQTWGFSDLHSWIPGFFPGFGAALPLDRKFNRKPAWWALHDVLANQAEFLPVTDISVGDSQLQLTNTFFSAGRARQLVANTASAFITLAIEIPYVGPYNVRVGVRKSNVGGQFQLAARPSVGSTFSPIGSAQDTYAAATSYVELNLGTATFATNGSYGFRFLVTGKSVSSGGYNLVLDYLRLIPTGTDGIQSPSVSGLADSVMQNYGAPLFIPFQISDRETVESALTMTVTSSNTTLLPNGNVVVLGAGQNRVLSLTPVTNQFGTSSLTTIVVDADGLATTNRFNLVVTPPSPLLGIGRRGDDIELNWPSNAVLWHLESTPTIFSVASWEPVMSVPTFTNGFWSVVVPKTGTNLFFRLAQ
jgi:endo-1,4-beta-xylanase